MEIECQGDDELARIGDLLGRWRSTGQWEGDRPGYRKMQAMWKRAIEQRGSTRQLLCERLSAHADAYARALSRQAGTPAPSSVPPGPATSPLAALLRYAEQRAQELPLHAGSDDASKDHPGRPRQGPELRIVRSFKRTWLRLDAERRLLEVMKNVPGQAGPLHSSHLVFQALKTMHAASPDYLGRFIAQVDTLLWIDRTSTIPTEGPGRKAEKDRRSKGRR